MCRLGVCEEVGECTYRRELGGKRGTGWMDVAWGKWRWRWRWRWGMRMFCGRWEKRGKTEMMCCDVIGIGAECFVLICPRIKSIRVEVLSARNIECRNRLRLLNTKCQLISLIPLPHSTPTTAPRFNLKFPRLDYMHRNTEPYTDQNTPISLEHTYLARDIKFALIHFTLSMQKCEKNTDAPIPSKTSICSMSRLKSQLPTCSESRNVKQRHNTPVLFAPDKSI
jgi:hypothetical protein